LVLLGGFVVLVFGRKMSSKSTAFEQNIKLLLLGDSGVGKTSLMMRFTDQTFSSTFVSTVGIDFKYKVITIEPYGSSKPVTIRLELWDTAGQERFKSITTSYLRGAQGILVCYDITDRRTFQRVDAWM
jgi:small GTP-binding protein